MAISAVQSQMYTAQETKPALYATDTWIKSQRIIGLALMTLGLLASTFSPLSAGASAAAAVPLFVTGSVLIGASLAQQSMGNAPNCEHSKTRRAVAGAFIMLLPVLGWLPGAVLWHEANEANKK
jgi:hypothetical protein